MRAITGGVLALIACGALAGCGAILGVDGDYFEVTDGGLQGDATNTNPDGSSKSDAGTDARTDSGKANTGIQCGSSICKPEENKICCISGPECKSPNDCSGNVYIECDAPADCAARGAGSICCATAYDGGVGTGAVKCVNSSSDCSDNGGNRKLCDPDAGTCQCTRTFTRFNMTFHYCD